MSTRRATEVPNEALGHLHNDQVAWLTTVTPTGAPSPTPVWFVWDGEAVFVFSEPPARKLANIARQSRVTLHFNSDLGGQDIVVIAARAEVDQAPPSEQPGYLDKYFRAIGRLQMTVAEFDAAFTARIRLTPISIWLGPD